jgi:hypothetical protein
MTLQDLAAGAAEFSAILLQAGQHGCVVPDQLSAQLSGVRTAGRLLLWRPLLRHARARACHHDERCQYDPCHDHFAISSDFLSISARTI